MGKLADAMPRQRVPEGEGAPSIQSERGVHRGIWIGMSPPVEWVSPWPNEACRLCKGQGTGYNGEGVCNVCHGTKKRTEKHVKMLYQLANGITEEEELNFKISPPGMGKNTQPLSPSTLFVRLRTLSGLKDPTVEQIDEWFTALSNPPNIPCQVVVDDNKNATYLKITNVLLVHEGGAQAQTHTRSFQPAAGGNGAAAADPQTRTFQPATLDAKLNNDIMDVAIDGLALSSEAWTGLLAKHVDGELVVGKTPQAKATTLLRELQHQKAQRTGQPLKDED